MLRDFGESRDSRSRLSIFDLGQQTFGHTAAVGQFLLGKAAAESRFSDSFSNLGQLDVKHLLRISFQL